MATNKTDSDSQEKTDRIKAIAMSTPPPGFVIVGTPTNRTELIAQQNVYALTGRNN